MPLSDRCLEVAGRTRPTSTARTNSTLRRSRSRTPPACSPAARRGGSTTSKCRSGCSTAQRHTVTLARDGDRPPALGRCEGARIVAPEPYAGGDRRVRPLGRRHLRRRHRRGRHRPQAPRCSIGMSRGMDLDSYPTLADMPGLQSGVLVDAARAGAGRAAQPWPHPRLRRRAPTRCSPTGPRESSRTLLMTSAPKASSVAGGGEVGEPHVEALDPALAASRGSGRASRRAHRRRGVEYPKRRRAGSSIAGPVGRPRARTCTCCCTDTRASPARLAHLVEPVELVDGDVPPVGVLGDQLPSSSVPVPPMTIGILSSGVGHLARGDELEPLDRRSRASRRSRARAGSRASPSGVRRARVPRMGRHAVGRELVDHRTPTDAELEASARRVVEGDRFTREHRGVAERVAQHELALHQTVGVREQPRVAS